LKIRTGFHGAAATYRLMIRVGTPLLMIPCPSL